MHFYRFSISWPRILPTEQVLEPNEVGLKYYDNLIDELLANGIEPVVTMYSWDAPLYMAQNVKSFNAWSYTFMHYANILFKRYASRVKTWITFNDPLHICTEFADTPGMGLFKCAKELLHLHALVYRHYKSSFGLQPDARMSISIDCPFAYPEQQNEYAHIQAAKRRMQFQVSPR